MFGKNRVAADRSTEATLLVQGNVWPTIQGEGPFAGEPAMFLRLAGCNLRCYFCDTDFESNVTEAEPATVARAIELSRLGVSAAIDLLVITGGEPMLQNLPALICALDEVAPAIKRIQIETAGSVWPDALGAYMLPRIDADKKRRAHVSVVVSPKTPEIHPEVRAHAIAWKYIVNAENCHADDGLPIMTTQGNYSVRKLARPRHKPCAIYVQPMDELDEGKNKANMQACVDTALKHGYRISLQMHKILGVE